MFLFFFFKQKTAYEMRISDWSSDVCSSDLPAFEGTQHRLGFVFVDGSKADRDVFEQLGCHAAEAHHDERSEQGIAARAEDQFDPRRGHLRKKKSRSEEHTSELQSLMRISYAVFCLKKKKNITNLYRRQKKTH